MLASRRVTRIRARRQQASEARAEIAQRAAGYVRVSTEEQAERGHGLEAQERAIRAFAESQGYELVAVYADPGVSGVVRPADRPGFAKLVAGLVDGAIALVIVWKFDRLARNIVYAVSTANELSNHGVALRSVTEPIDTATPMGRTIFAVLAGMAEQERQGITERTWSGRKEKAGKGGFACGGTPYGYRRDKDGGLVIDPHEAKIVRRIFKLKADGMGAVAIAALLNADGQKTRRGKSWRHGRVSYILDNPKYQGAVEYLFRWSGAEQHVLMPGAHEAIIS